MLCHGKGTLANPVSQWCVSYIVLVTSALVCYTLMRTDESMLLYVKPLSGVSFVLCQYHRHQHTLILAPPVRESNRVVRISMIHPRMSWFHHRHPSFKSVTGPSRVLHLIRAFSAYLSVFNTTVWSYPQQSYHGAPGHATGGLLAASHMFSCMIQRRIWISSFSRAISLRRNLDNTQWRSRSALWPGGPGT